MNDAGLLQRPLLAVLFMLAVFHGRAQNEVTGNETPCGGSIETYTRNFVLEPSLTPKDYKTTQSFEYQWVLEDGTCGAPGAANCSTGQTPNVQVTWDTNCEDGLVTGIYVLTYKDTADSVRTKNFSKKLKTKIKVPPSSLTISGASNVPCQLQAPQTYSISACVDSNTYAWSVGSGWTIISGQGTKKISVKPDPYNASTISVTAGCGAVSSQGSNTVTRSCLTHVPFINPTNPLPPHTVATDQITLSNTTGSATVVPNGSSVHMEAGILVRIGPEFKVQSGGYFKAKIGPCIDCLAFKREQESQSLEAPDDAEIQAVVCPNPSNGDFRLQLGTPVGPGIPTDVRMEIWNSAGRPVLVRTISSGTPAYPVQLHGEPAGVYFIRLMAGGQTLSQKVIIQ